MHSAPLSYIRANIGITFRETEQFDFILVDGEWATNPVDLCFTAGLPLDALDIRRFFRCGKNCRKMYTSVNLVLYRIWKHRLHSWSFNSLTMLINVLQFIMHCSTLFALRCFHPLGLSHTAVHYLHSRCFHPLGLSHTAVHYLHSRCFHPLGLSHTAVLDTISWGEDLSLCPFKLRQAIIWKNCCCMYVQLDDS